MRANRRTLAARTGGGAALLLLLACGGPATGGPGEADAGAQVPSSLYPLKAGNRWTYRVTDMTTGAVTHKETTVGAVETMDGAKAGVQAYVLTTASGADRWTAYVEVGQDGFANRHREDILPGGALAVRTLQVPFALRAPLLAPAAGSWSEQYTEDTLDPWGALLRSKVHSYRWTVEATSEFIAVPAGNFKTLKLVRVRTTNGDTKTTWWATGVGKIRDDDQGDGTSEELESYQVQP